MARTLVRRKAGHDGRQMNDRRTRRLFYEALKACGLEAGRKGFTLYDTKKTAAGLLIDSGLSEREAMYFSGHATPSMFDRYLKKTAARHGESVRRRDEYLKRRLAENQGPDAEKCSISRGNRRARSGFDPHCPLQTLLAFAPTSYVVSPGWLKIDPKFDALFRSPTFQKLIATAR